MALLDTPTRGGLHHASSRGELWCWSAGPDVVIIKFKGYLEQEVGPSFTAEFNKVMPKKLRALFFDAGEMNGYDSGFRVHLTDWAKALKPRTGAMHVFVKSKIVQMGAAVANLALGGILRFHPSKGAMEEAVRKLVG
jgi:hypothetical protein